MRKDSNIKLRTSSSRKRAYISSSDEDLDLQELLEDNANAKKPKVNANNMQKPKTCQCSVMLDCIDDQIKEGLDQLAPHGQKVLLAQNKKEPGSDIEEMISETKTDDEKKHKLNNDSKSHKEENNIQNFPLNKIFRKRLGHIKKRRSLKTELGHKSVVKAKEANKDGWHQVTMKGKKKKKMKKLYTCPEKDCNFWKPVKAAAMHPNFRWECHRCACTFATKVGCYKHEL